MENQTKKNSLYNVILIMSFCIVILILFVIFKNYYDKNTLKINNLEKENKRLLNIIQTMGEREESLNKELKLYQNLNID